MTNAGKCVRVAQAMRDISSANLARLSGVQPQQVMRWRKQENMKLHTMQQLCIIFEMGLDEFSALDR
jgi:DNA-binding Xre family transcriptional regulator